jgi:alkaline phosphatase D
MARFVLAIGFVATAILPNDAWASIYQATGFKVGEVTESTAIVWTRLTARAERNPSDGPMVEIRYGEAANVERREQEVHGVFYPEGVTVRDIQHAVPGADGQVRVSYRPTGDEKWKMTNWRGVESMRDFTYQFRLRDLKAGTRYTIRVETKGIDGEAGQALEGGFRTAPAAGSTERVVFTVSTGQGNDDMDCPEGFKIYPSMLTLDPDFFVHTGDIIYYDGLAKTVDLARYHWWKTYSWPTNVAFHRQVSSYFMKDDHDTWKNDCWPTMKSDYMHEFTFQQGVEIFKEQVPMQRSTYRKQRWGKDLEVWMVEGRDFRSPNTMKDGPDKTIWGAEQKAWFKTTVAESDATFRLLISPTPVVGPDRASKSDNHSNSVFRYEGDEIRRFLAGQKHMAVVCGDRHWQYMSVDPNTKVREYSCGPASDSHAGGWQQDDFREDYHRYLNVIGGFLSGTVERVGGKATLTFRYHDVDGKVKFEDVMTAE